MEKKQFELFDQVALIKTSFIKDGWATVYQSNKAEVDTQIYCNIVHDEYLTEYLDHHNWMIEPGREGRPSIISRGGQQSSYHAFSENGIEPFLYYKFFTHNKEKYIDVSEEFINYFHLYETGSSKQNRTYFFTDENGDLEEAIKIEAELVQVKLRFLMEYISVRNVHFTVCFDFMCMSSEKLSSFGLEEKYVPFNDEHTHYTHLIRVLPFTGAGELQSWIHGKVIIKNMESRRHSYWFDAGSEDFASFIIGYDQAGDLDKVSSDSEEHKFFTLTYFSKTVLDKYYNNPDKYKVSGYCGREDARNYIFVLDLLDKFTKRAPASEIEPLINSFQDGVMTYSAWNPSDTALSWAGLRNTELMNWNLLAEKLGTLTVNLNELSWFEPGMVIEEYLLKIYSSSRSILNKKHGHGIDQLFQPGIRERMADQYTQVYLLEEWLKKKPEHELWPIAQELKLQIASFKAAQPSGNEQGTTTLSNVVPAVAKFDGKEKTEFQNFIAAYIQTNSASTSKNVVTVFEKICDQLTEVPSFNDAEVKLSFQTILYQSLVFLKLRMDHTKKNHPAMGYLFKSSKNALESALQEDYYTYMSAQPALGDLQTETMDVASGRADVSFNFGSYRIFTEVKREIDDCSFDNLCKLYLGQVMEYGNTSAKLGILLVLDLTDKSHGVGSFESQVKHQISSAPSDQEKRGVVIIKVPGNRVTPSAVKKSQYTTQIRN